jgi:hypothetical protein
MLDVRNAPGHALFLLIVSVWPLDLAVGDDEVPRPAIVNPGYQGELYGNSEGMAPAILFKSKTHLAIYLYLPRPSHTSINRRH